MLFQVIRNIINNNDYAINKFLLWDDTRHHHQIHIIWFGMVAFFCRTKNKSRWTNIKQSTIRLGNIERGKIKMITTEVVDLSRMQFAITAM